MPQRPLPPLKALRAFEAAARLQSLTKAANELCVTEPAVSQQIKQLETYLRRPDGELIRIDVPEDSEMAAHREWLLIRTKSAWQVGSATYPAGALLAAPLRVIHRP